MMPDKSMRVWVAVFVLMVFLGGMGAGILVSHFLPYERGPRFGRGPGGPGERGERGPGGPGGPMGAPTPAWLVDRLASELQLTPDQRTKVEAVFAARQPRLDQFHRDVRERFENEQRQMREELRKILTPDQQKRFDEWIARREPPPGARRPGPPF